MPSDYSHTNLSEVKDSAAEYGHGDAMEARFAGESVGARDTGFSLHRVKPNRRQPFGHRHEEAEEVYVVIRGSGRINLDGEVVELRELDAVRVGPAVARCVEAGEEGIEFLAFGPRREGDGELLPGWWGEQG